MGGLLFQAFIYLCAAVIAVPIAKRLGLGSVLGYLIAGIAISQVLRLLGVDVVSIQHFAEFGVVMMLFLVGLELEPRMLWTMRNKLLGLGGLQVVDPQAYMIQRRRVHTWLLPGIDGLHQVDLDAVRAEQDAG